MLAKRIIACLDVDGDRVVKGVRFRDHRIVGGVIELAQRYVDDGADELVFYDISASAEARRASVKWIRRLAEVVDIPFCVGGGVTSLALAESLLEAGADKISLNSPALADPGLIDLLARTLGSQCVVVGIDSRREGGVFRPWARTGRIATTTMSDRTTAGWIKEAQARGAGEIVLNCMDHDGTRTGYDLVHLNEARLVCRVPLIASGGAGTAQHFEEAFALGVDGALVAGVLHAGILTIPRIKDHLAGRGYPVRTCTKGAMSSGT